MEKRLIEFIENNNLSPLNKTKTQIKTNNSIYKTKDAKIIHNKVLSKISTNFIFPDTSNLFYSFGANPNIEEIKTYQDFFQKIKNSNEKKNQFLKKIKIPKSYWKPDYNVIVATENTDIYTELKKRGCPAKLLISENDLMSLQEYDVVQIFDCSEYGLALEKLPQAVFLNSIDETYLERYLETLSGWKENIEILKENSFENIYELDSLIYLTNKQESEILNKDYVEKKVEEINNKINQKIKQLTLSGDSVIALIHKKEIPGSLKEIINISIKESKLEKNILNLELPVSIDYEELESTIQKQSAIEFSSISENIKKSSNELILIPQKLEELSKNLILYDFISGISNFIKQEMIFPKHSEEIKINNSKNIFLENPQPISFNLTNEIKCSILTGANSGGKTTLIEHIIQLITLFYFGLPVFGDVTLPLFSEIYYFAKNKGSMNKGAFETLLTQMSKIKPGNRTLILADEIEAVTEPGVAGNIISATAAYYIEKNCFLIIATHLGYEIQKILPEKTRIDGIEAKGLSEEFELIVDHNPVLGRLARSTPELIVKKMAKSQNNPYFTKLNEFLEKNQASK